MSQTQTIICFLMIMPDERVFTFADCAIVPAPDESQLASIARILTECGFKDVRHVGRQKDLFTFKQRTVSGYKVLAKGSNDILGWRLLIDGLGDNGLKNEALLTSCRHS